MLMRIIIFGAANTGMSAFQLLRSRYEIVAFSDNNAELIGKKLFNVPIIQPETISSIPRDFVVIASIYHVDIVKQLWAMGVKDVKLFQPIKEGNDCILLELNGGEPFQNVIYKKFETELYRKGYLDERKTNHQRRRRVLIIAYYFPPIGGSPIQRTLKYVKYLREYGYEPVVLTTEINPDLGKYSLDYSLLSDIPEGIQVIRIKDAYTYPDVVSKEKSQEIFELLYRISDSKEWMELYIKAQKTQTKYILPDGFVLWANECIRHIEEYIDMQEIDLLYSTVPDWSHHLVAYYLKQKYGIKWVADYRDPWVSNEAYVSLYYPWMTKEEIALDQKLEKRLTEKMDSIIVAGGKWSVDFVENYGVKVSKIKEITNGYDEDDFKNIDVNTKKNKKFTLCYNGVVVHNRNPIPVLRALNDMIERREVKKDEIRWIFNGWISEDYQKRMGQEDRYHIVTQNGMLPHKESIRIAMQSDVMVMYGEQGEKGYLNYPGKFYEYLRIGKPILCFSSSQSFQGEVLHETGLGVNMDLDDSEGIKKYLGYQIALWRRGENISVNDFKSIQKYERRNLTRALADEFNRTLGIDISIIIPLYKGVQFCNRLLKIIRQNCSYQDFYKSHSVEVIFVNDYPEEKIIIEKKENEFAIRLLCHEKNQGIHAARVTGIKNSRGQFIIMLDQDDLVRENWLYSQWNCIQEAQSDVCLCNGWDGKFRLLHDSREFEQRIKDDNYLFKNGNPIMSPGQAIIKKERIPREWLDNLQKINGTDDFLLWIMMKKQGCSFAVNKECLYYHTSERTKDSVNVRHMINSLKEMRQILSTTGKFLNENNKSDLDQYIKWREDTELSMQTLKERNMLFVMKTWLDMRNQGMEIASFLEKRQYLHIAVYGMGNIGESLFYELNNSGIHIDYAIDSSSCVKDFDEELTILNWADEFPDVDAVIVTMMVGYDDVIHALKARLKRPVITVYDLILDMQSELLAKTLELLN